MNNNLYNKSNQVKKSNTYNNVYYLLNIAIILVIVLITTNKAQSQIAPVLNPSGGFEIDGGLNSGTPTSNTGDWVLGANGSYILYNNGTPVNSTTSGMVTDDYNSNTDLSFNASKFNQDPNTWTWSASKPSSKNDINQVLYHIANDASNNTWLIVAGDRFSTNGTSYIDFEFLQNTLTRNASGGFNSAGPDGGRTINDIVLSMEYDNGGSLATVHMYFWKFTGSGYEYVEQTIPSGVAFAMTNASNENVPFGAFGATSYFPYQFVEGAINLSAFFGFIDPCFGISVNTLLVKTKASTSTTASLGDFVDPIQVKFNFGTATINYSADLCNTGVADVNLIGVPGGTFSSSPAGLSINSATGQINLSSSSVGTYTITYSFVTNNCPKTVTTSVTINPLPTAPSLVSVDRSIVCTDDNGNITLTATGGSGTTLQWFEGSCSGTPIGTGSSITIPSPSSTTTYFASWTTSCGVSSCAQATVSVTQLMSVSATGSSQVSCTDYHDGTINVSATGGNGIYSYSLNGGPLQSSNVFNGLSSGTYTATVIDGLGCSGSSSAVVISNPPSLSLTASGTSQVSCYNATDGSVSATATGGSGSYLYSLNGGTFQTSSSFTGLSAGNYTIMVKDSKGCTLNASVVTIANPPILSASASGSSQVSCYNSADGSITVSTSGGTGDYSYSLNGGAYQSSNIFSGLVSGSYVINVQDANSCDVNTAALTISNPIMISASATGSSQVSCYNAADGSITVSATGGTGSYSYSINGGTFQSSNIFSRLNSGSYVINVIDENNCAANTSALTISNPAMLAASANGSSQVSCYNSTDGSITVSASGGTGSYLYSINGGAFQSSNMFTGLGSGSYVINVQDANSCQVNTAALTIANPAMLSASASGSSQVSCYNSTDGSIMVSATGGTGSYLYSLNGGSFQSSNMFSGLSSGSYVINVQDANLCAVNTSALTISNPAMLAASAIGSPQVSCYNLADGSITVTANGGTGSYTYSLSNGPSQYSNVFNGVSSGTYQIKVIDANGCSALTNQLVISNPYPVYATANGSAQVSCYDSADGSISVSASGGTGAYSYSLNGGAFQSSNVFSGLTSGTYVINVQDANSCAFNTTALTIANPATVNAYATGSPQVSCYNSADGWITVSASGGTGAYSYSLNGGAFQSSNVFSGLTSGSYVINVLDANSCAVNTSAITIINPAKVAASVAGSSQVSCFNAADGTITVSANGGTGSYSYSLNGGTFQSSNVFEGLPSGSYVITVIDENNCAVNAAALSISNPALLNAYATGSSQVSCYNSADGTITVSASGGTGTLSYSLNGSPFQSSNIFNGLTSGSYVINVQDANSCAVNTTALTISNPVMLAASATGSPQVTCFNSADGSITVAASGGTGNYSYSLNGSTFQSSNVFTGLASGSYVINVQDENNCAVNTPSLIIANPAMITATVTGSPQVSCHNSADGSITVSASGGTGAYSYSLNGGVFQGSNVFTGLSSGSYIINVQDEYSCAVNTSVHNIANPAMVEASAVGSSQVSCYNSADASIIVSASGGTGSFSYSINGGELQSSNTFSGLTSGSYVIKVLDENNCPVNVAAVTIANPAMVEAYATGSSQVSCNNFADGSISVNATGGTGAYSYSLNGGSFQSSNVFTGLTSGSYIINVQDANSCAVNTSALTIANPVMVSVSATGSSQVSCYNSADGSITVSASGGTGSYSYSLNGSPFQSSNVFTGLTSGSYVINVQDENNCAVNAPAIMIANPAMVSASANGSSQVSCFNSADGSITVAASGGTGSYSYSLNGSPFQSSNVFAGLTSGSYIINVIDENNCAVNTPVLTIANPASLLASSYESAPISCHNGNNGEITVTAQGGTGQYSYSINGGGFQSNNLFSGLTEGSYSIIISDENGCTRTTKKVYLRSPEPISVSAQQSDVNCFGTSAATLSIQAMGGTPPFHYSIDGGVNYQSSNSFENLHANNYIISVYDANNCMADALNFTVLQSEQIIANVNVISPNKCYGVNDASISIDIESGNSHLSYFLDNNEHETGNQIDGISAGNHTIKIVDNLGCGYETEFYIEPQNPLEVNLISSSYANCAGKRDGALAIEAVGGQGPYSYQWSNGQSTSDIAGLDAGEYSLTVTDEFGCTTYFSDNVYVGPVETELGFNNVFTPNGDGINDLWVIKNLELYPDNQLVIINRWGNEVLTVKDYKNNWDGSQLNEGTYFYLLKVNMCDEDRVLDGYITIIR